MMPHWLISIWAAPAALGFALLFNVPPRALPGCCAMAVLAVALRNGIVAAGGDLVVATLAAACLVGVLAQALARRLRHVSAIYAISAVIPLVPGVFMYHAVQAMLRIAMLPSKAAGGALLEEAGVNAIRAGMVLLALTIGIAAPRLLWPQRHG
ncbi:threonine/serine exporter family protein [Silvimonas sp. JCM 19000]